MHAAVRLLGLEPMVGAVRALGLGGSNKVWPDLSLTDLYSALIGCALVTASLSYLWSEPTYDEANYLQLARKITEVGLPLRRVYEDFTEFQLFQNSPPFVLYVASLSQWLFPGDEIPTRVVHIALFVLPTYALVWRVARGAFGAWAALASLVVLFTNGPYLGATTHVGLNVPLGLLACIALFAFHEASSSAEHRTQYIVLVMLATAFAAWTKYQAVCIAVAAVAYMLFRALQHGYSGIRSTLPPLFAMMISGATAVVALLGYFWAFGGRDTVMATLAWNAGRMSPESMSAVDIARAVMATARECETALGGAVLLLGAAAISTEHRARGLIILLGSYVAASIAFNVALFRMPGAGAAYLHSAVPALAILAGSGSARLIALASSSSTRILLIATALAIHLAGSPIWPYQRPRPNGSRTAAEYIAASSPPTEGVLAETVAIEFYSGHPVQALGNTFPRELVLQSLEGRTPENISFVVVDATAPPKNLSSIQQQWNALLARHFEPVAIVAPGLKVYRRRSQ